MYTTPPSRGTLAQENTNVIIEESFAPMPAHLQRLAKLIIVAVLVLTPLLFFPPNVVLHNSLDTPRRLVLALGAGVLATLVLYAWSLRKRLVLRWHALDGGVVLFFLAAVVSGIGGVYPVVTFFGPVWTNDGLLLLATMVLLYFGLKEFVRSPEDRSQTAYLLVAVGGLVALIGLVERFIFDPQFAGHFSALAGLKFNPSFSGSRLMSTLGNPMFTGTYLAMLLPLGVAVALTATSRSRLVVTLISLELALFALFFTLARAAWVGVALALPILLIVLLWRRRVSRREQHQEVPLFRAAFSFLVLLFVLNIGLGIAVVCMDAGLRDRFRSMTQMTQDGTVQTRKVYMEASWNMFLARPIQGWGLGNIQYVFPQYRPYSLIQELGLPLNRGYNTSLPHNLPLQIAAEMGVIGLFAFILLVVLLYAGGIRQLRLPSQEGWLTLGLLGMLTVYLLINLMAFDNAATRALFWTGLSLLAGVTAVDRTLSPRYGAWARPLTARASRVLRCIGLIVLIGVSAQVFMQTIAAVNLKNGVRALSMLFEPGADQPALCEQAIWNISTAVLFSPSPFFWIEPRDGSREIDHGLRACWSSNFTLYDTLMFAYRSQRDLAQSITNQAAQQGDMRAAEYWNTIFQQAAKMMYRNGEIALRMVDRDPLALRYLLVDYTKEGRFTDAHRVGNLLVTYEPRSAEVHLMYADLLSQEGKSDDALTHGIEAVRLDPTFPEAYAMAGHYHHMIVTEARPNIKEHLYHLQESCQNYGTAVKMGTFLQPEHRLEYALDLFMLQRAEEGIAQGRQLYGTSLFTDLCDDVTKMYRRFELPEEGARIVRELQQGNTSR